MRTIKQISIFAFFIITNFVYSQNTWLPVTTTFEPEVKTSMALNKNSSMWIKVVSKNIEYYTAKGKKITNGSKLVLYKVDCENRKMGILHIAIYDEDGKTLNTTEFEDYNVNMSYVIPDSVGEIYLDTYCNLSLSE